MNYLKKKSNNSNKRKGKNIIKYKEIQMKKNKFLIIIFSFIIASIMGIINYNINLKEVEVSNIVKASNTIIPRPLKYEENKGEFLLNKDTKIYI